MTSKDALDLAMDWEIEIQKRLLKIAQEEVKINELHAKIYSLEQKMDFMDINEFLDFKKKGGSNE